MHGSDAIADKSRSPLKGQCNKIFCFRFFSYIIFPQAPKNNNRVISIFFENLQRYLQVKGTTGINDTGGKFAASVNYTCDMTPAANLPLVSLAANFATGTAGFVDTSGKFATGVNNVPKKN
jgi:hypothetical protein